MSELFKYCQRSLSVAILYNESKLLRALVLLTFTVSAHLCISADDYSSFSFRVEGRRIPAQCIDWRISNGPRKQRLRLYLPQWSLKL